MIGKRILLLGILSIITALGGETIIELNLSSRMTVVSTLFLSSIIIGLYTYFIKFEKLK